MKRTVLVAGMAALVFCVADSAFAIYSVSEKGVWPQSWPQELEPLRKQSRTFVGPHFDYKHHAIPFTKREEFESAWSHILKVKSKGTPILLVRAPNFFVKAGVVVHAPPPGQANKPAAPEVPINSANVRVRWSNTTYIELVVDGEIVDLNRIRLPADTLIIDERFEDTQDDTLNQRPEGETDGSPATQASDPDAPAPELSDAAATDKQGGNKLRDEIATLRERVAALEAELADVRKQRENDKLLSKLLGKWKERSCVIAGRQQNELDEVMWRIETDVLSERLVLAAEVETQTQRFGAVSIDATKNPVWIDFTLNWDGDKYPLRGIVKYSYNEATIVLPHRSYDGKRFDNPPRPTSFESTEENRASVYRLVRQPYDKTGW